MSDFDASLVDRLRVAANNFNRAWDGSTCALMDEAANEIARLRDIVCEYELREAENTLTPEEVEAILDRYTRQPFTPKIPDVDTGADGNNNQHPQGTTNNGI